MRHLTSKFATTDHSYISDKLKTIFFIYRMATILAFDVKIEREAQTIADDVGVKIFSADIIYHLQDAFLKHRFLTHITTYGLLRPACP